MKNRNKLFTGRVFPNLFEPTTLEEVRGKLGISWRVTTKTIIRMVEWLEELNPTDEDEEKYREFRLSGYNPELCSIFNRDCVRGLISICVRIGLIKITNPNYSIGFFGKSYIYSPAVGAILEDLLRLSKIPVKRRRNYTPVETWEA